MNGGGGGADPPRGEGGVSPKGASHAYAAEEMRWGAGSGRRAGGAA